MVVLSDISDYLTKLLGSWIGPVPFFAIPALVLGIGVAVWFLKKSVKKEKVIDPSKGSKLQTAKDYLKENLPEGTYTLKDGSHNPEEESPTNNGKMDLEDKLINALVSAVSNAQVSSGRLSLVIDPDAKKRVSLAKSQIDFDLSPPANGEEKVVPPVVPIPPQEGAEEGV